MNKDVNYPMMNCHFPCMPLVLNKAAGSLHRTEQDLRFSGIINAITIIKSIYSNVVTVVVYLFTCYFKSN